MYTELNNGVKVIVSGKNRKKKTGWMALPRKVRRNISISVMIIMAICLLIGGAKVLTNYREANLQSKLNSFEYVDVYVEKGQTAYELQEELTPNKDVRELLFYASYKNEGRSLGDIQAGEIITLIKE